MADRVSTRDEGYLPGDLSFFPLAFDDKSNLYECKNNAETTLSQSLPYNAKIIYVNSTDSFPDTGLLRIGPKSGPGNFEIIYYGKKTQGTFSDLIRGFVKTTQTKWDLGSNVIGAVMAEHHNALKDAVLNIMTKLGTKDFPAADSINGKIKQIEVKHLAPKVAFKAYPKSGAPPLNVRFQNLSSGDIVRYLWDFGDGSTSIEQNPNHTYIAEGIYTVKLNIITTTRSQASAVKNNYINVSNENKVPFFYFTQQNVDDTGPFSQKSADEESVDPAIFEFVDQTDGDISQRYWIFGDGTTAAVSDPNIHTTTHIYENPGEYVPTLMIILSDGSKKFVSPQESLIVL